MRLTSDGLAPRRPIDSTWQLAWIGGSTIVRTEVRRFLRIWVQTLVPPAITMLLYLFIFGSIIGARVGSVGDWPYITFIGPGIIAMALINNAYANVSSSFFSAKNHRFYEEMFVTPLPSSAIAAGYVMGGVLRGLLVAIIVTVVVRAFTPIPLHSPVVLLVAAILTAWIFASLGFINALLARNHDDANWVSNFVLLPMTYLGGVFFPMSYLPDVIEPIASLNPILLVVTSFRYAVLGIGADHVWLSLGLLAVLTAVIFGLAAWMLHRRIGLSA